MSISTDIEPGIRFGMSSTQYFADPCPLASCTQSLAKLLLDRSPRHAWLKHPRLNPDYVADDPTKYDVGNVAHRLLIGRGKDIVEAKFDNWMTNAAKTARQDAAAEGKLAVLTKDIARATAMVAAAREQLWGDYPEAFNDGNGEVAIMWPEADIWCRSLIDWATPGGRILYDYKTTGMNCAPHAIARKMATDDWAVQAAWQDRGLDACQCEHTGKRKFRFIAQEDDPPYALTVSELSEAVMSVGRKRVAIAIAIWRRCYVQDDWPMYPSALLHPEYPGYTETAWLERETNEFAEILAAG